MNRRTVLIAVAIVAVAAVVSAGVVWYVLDSQGKAFTLGNFLGLFSAAEDDNSGNLFNTTNTSSTTIITDDKELPSSLQIFINPSVVDRGDWVIGQATSDGRNFAMTINVVHLGSGESDSIPAGIGDDHTYELAQPVFLPGLWEFQATAENGVKSNVAHLTVNGIQVEIESNHYSKTMRDSLELHAYTNYVSTDVMFIANDIGPFPSSILLGTVTSNAGGYAHMTYNFDSLANGDYVIDAIVGSDSATVWGCTQDLTIGR